MTLSPAVRQVIAKINRRHGSGTVLLGSEIKLAEHPVITSGSLSVDAALGGGWATNHWIEIVGNECLCPGTRVLCADLVWRPIEDLHLGQEIVGFGEQISGMGRGCTSHFEKAFVTHLGRKTLPVYEIETIFGKTYASGGHLWIRDRGQRQWARTDQLSVGDTLSAFGAPWAENTSWEAGWLAGFYDGEGSLRADNAHDSHSIGVNQVLGETADFCAQMLGKLGFEYYELFCKRSRPNWQDQTHYRLRGYQALRFMGEVRPQRLLPKAESLWNGRSTKKIGAPTVKVRSIKYVGLREVVTIGTSTKTLIADGLLSHNSAGKTMVVLKTIAANQRLDPEWTVVWFATEDFNEHYAEMWGVDLNRVIVVEENTMEAVYEYAIDFLESKSVDCLVIDSYPALVPAREEGGEMTDFQPGLAAFLTGKFFRMANPSMKRSYTAEQDRPVTGFVINQWREKITTYGDPRTTPGGKAKNFFYFQRVEVRRKEFIKNSREQPVGQRLEIVNLKNKLAPPGRVGQVDGYFADYAGHRRGTYDTVKDIVAAAETYEVVKREGQRTYAFNSHSWSGRPAMQEAIRSDKQLQKELRRAVLVAARPGRPSAERPTQARERSTRAGSRPASRRKAAPRVGVGKSATGHAHR